MIGEAQCVSVQVCAHASPWMQMFALSNMEPIHCASQKGHNTRPHISLHLLSVDIKARISELLKLPLPNHLFCLLLLPHHTWISVLPPSCICLFLNHLRSFFSPRKLLEFVHLISTLTYSMCYAGCYVKLMKYIGSPTRHVRTQTHTQAHTVTCLSAHSWHTFWLLNSFHSNVKWLTIMYSVMAGNDKHCPVVHQHQSLNIFCSPTNVLQAKEGKDPLCRVL